LTVSNIIESTIYEEICTGDSYLFNSQQINLSGTYMDTLMTSNGCDSIVTLELLVSNIIESTIYEQICTGDSYQFNGQQLTSTGTYVDTLVTTNNCDSIVTLDLTVSDIIESTRYEQLCVGSSYLFNGQQLATAGTYKDTLVTANNCDSIVNLVLTFSNIIKSTKYEQLCAGDSYYFNGQYLTSSGTYLDTLVTSSNCDSIVTLQLIVSNQIETTIHASICEGEPYNFNGQQINQSGTYIANLISSNNCDSVVTLVLDISNPIHKTINQSICTGSTYFFDGQDIGSTGIYVDTFLTSDNCDSIVTLVLEVANTIQNTINASICEGNSYNFNGQLLTQSGIYQESFITSNSCDSIVTLHLNVSNYIEDTQFQSICSGSYFFFNGNALDAAGTYQDTLKTNNNCDSIITLNLSVSNPIQTTIYQSICEGTNYYFADQQLTTAGTYTNVLTTSSNCDSIVMLVLDITPALESTVYENICAGDGYYFGGQWLQSAGSYTDTLVTANNCDSIVTLQLTVSNLIETTVNRVICSGDTYYFNERQLTTTGTYFDTLKTASNCDSIVTLRLSVSNLIESIRYQTICAGDGYYFNGQWLTINGVYKDTLTTANSCDSVVTLQLSVTSPPIATIQRSICSGETYVFNGTTISSAGTYYDTLQTIENCDSIVQLMLQVNQSSVVNIFSEIEEGDSYDFNGQSLTTAGSYQTTLIASNGCDSIIQLQLEVIEEVEGADGTDENACAVVKLFTNERLCEGEVLEFHGEQYTSSGYYRVIEPTSCGENIFEVELEVVPLSYTTREEIICQGESFYFNGNEITNSGIYKDTLLATTGCDSIVELHLQVSSTSQIPDKLCTHLTRSNGLNSNYVFGIHYSKTTNTIYAATVNGLAISRNGGETFENRTTANGLGHSYVSEVFESGDTLYAMTQAGLSFSVDGGVSFINKTISNEIGENNTNSFYRKGNIIYVAAYQALWKSTDGGESFANITSITNGLPVSYGYLIYGTKGRIYVKNGAGLYVSTDDGQSFSRLSINASFIFCIYQSNNRLYVGSNSGLFISTDGERFIQKTSTDGLAHNSVFDVKEVDGIVYVATYGGGVSISLDNGDSFTHSINNGGLEDNRVFDMSVVEGEIYMGTRNGVHICSNLSKIEKIICRGDSYDFYGELLTSTGTYKTIVEDDEGCGAEKILHLTVLEPTDTVITVSIEEGDTYSFKELDLDTPGIYYDTLTSSMGCDSIVILNLEVFSTLGSGRDRDPCLGIPADGRAYYKLDVKVRRVSDFGRGLEIYLQDGDGNNLSADDVFATPSTGISTRIEQSDRDYYYYFIRSQDYVSSTEISVRKGGIKFIIDILQNVGGALGFSYSPHQALVNCNIEICSGEEYDFRGRKITNSGTFINKYSIHGVTTNEVIQVEVLEPKISGFSHQICNGESYLFNENPITESGVYFDTLTAINGCDSIVQLNLTVTDPERSSIVLQPDASVGKDALIFINGGVSSGSSGSGTTHLLSAFEDQSRIQSYRGLIEFDLSSIPNNWEVSAAYLSLYSNPSLQHRTSNRNGWIERITNSWEENGVEWNNQPSTTTQNRVLLPSANHPLKDFLNIDVTTLLEDMLENPESSYGFMLKADGYLPRINFCSSDCSFASKRPKLEIHFEQVASSTTIPQSKQICSGEEYEFYGQVLTESGGYTQVLYENCQEQIIELALTVLETPEITIESNFNTSEGNTAYSSSTNLSSFEEEGLGITFSGLQTGDLVGRSLSEAGDINGDGIDDILIGAKGADYNGTSSGAAYVIFGSSTPLPFNFDLNSLNGENGFSIRGASSFDELATSVSALGDINGDGLDDIALSTSKIGRTGEVYIIYGSRSRFQPIFNVTTLNGQNGFTIEGKDQVDGTNMQVSQAGDINGDGFNDILVSAPFASENAFASGEAYLIFGQRNFLTRFNLANLNGTNGFQIPGTTKAEQLGAAIGGGVDINGDGLADLFLGAPGKDDPIIGDEAGVVYVIFGTTTAFPITFNLTDLTGDNGFQIKGGIAYGRIGNAIKGINDMNGDGRNELAIGARDVINNDRLTGACYFIFGNNAFRSSVNVAELNGNDGFTLYGQSSAEQLGTSVANIGDINGDDLGDVVIGAYGDSEKGFLSGSTYVIFGQSNNAAIKYSSDLDGTNGFELTGKDQNDLSGYAVSSAGDINNDGIADVLLGAWGATPNGPYSGEAYVLYGRSGSNLTVPTLSNITGGPTTYSIDYNEQAEAAGFVDVYEQELLSNEIPIVFPDNSNGRNYQATLTVSNGICDSKPIDITPTMSSPEVVRRKPCLDQVMEDNSLDVCDCLPNQPTESILQVEGDESIPPNIYYSALIIQATGEVLADESVMLKAGEVIDMSAGFEANPGSDFVAEIGLCPIIETVTSSPETSRQITVTSPSTGYETQLQIAPNPFKEQTNIQLKLEQDDLVSLMVYDQAGRLVHQILTKKYLTKGTHDFILSGELLTGGLFFLELVTSNERQMKKMILIDNYFNKKDD